MTLIQLLAMLEDLGIGLQVEDDNLKINAPKGTLTPDLVNELKNKKEEIIAFFHKKARQQETYAAIHPAVQKEYYELSSGQKRLFILQRIAPESIGYNIPFALALEGELDLEKLASVFARLIQRHESLRTSFEIIGDRPVQKIHDNVEFEIEYYDLATDEHGQTRTFLKVFAGVQGAVFSKKAPWPPEAIIKSFIRPFDLSRAPLLRVGLIKTGNSRTILIVDMHHIITDGTSTGILTTEFMRLYEGKALPGLKVQYKDYAEWDNRQREGELFKQQETFWLKEFEEEVPVLDLPTDFLRPAVQSFAGSMLSFELDSRYTRALKQLANREGATLFTVLLSIYNIFLAKISNQEVVVIGTPSADRPHAELQSVIGMFVNTLPLKNEPVGQKTVRAFMGEVKEKTLAAFANQGYQYEELVENLKLNRDASRNPLFDTMFAHQDMDFPEIEIAGLKLIPYSYEHRIAKFDLMLVSGETGDHLSLSFEYCTKLFKQETIERFIAYFRKVVSAMVERPDEKISAIEIVSAEEKERLLYNFNRTGAEYPRHKSVHRLFEEQVERTPDHLAAAAPKAHETHEITNNLSYKELNKRANRLARLLREQGVTADSVVGLLVEPDVPMMIGMMGILKAGGSYLPIDPRIPTGRVEYIVNDAALHVLLYHNTSADKIVFNGVRFNLDQENILAGTAVSGTNPDHNSQPRDLVYVIYTSGSTGHPKGVGVEHSQLVNFLFHMYNRYDGEIGVDDRCLNLTNIMFDVSVWELFLPLVLGAQLIIYPGQKRFDVFALAGTILDEAITLIYLPPALLGEVCKELLKQRSRLSLNKMLVGVEPIRDEVLEGYMRLSPRMRIINGYGPTETTICCSSVNYTTHEPRGEIVPIGVPLSNNQIVLLDATERVVPQGIAGEVCVSGDGVSRGYLNNPELTAEKYAAHPYFSGKRMYRTGDLARLLPEGNIHFIGRKDQQLKVRGYRIELGEIENRLLKHNHIRQTLVLAKTDEVGGKYLCAYIVSDVKLEMQELREYLGRDLPDYMIPSYFVYMESIPLTPNGKVDRKALPEPDVTTMRQEYTPPRNAVEMKLTELWSEVLGIEKDKISINADFFQLGGHSLKATLLLSKIDKEFNVRIPMTEIFTTPYVQGLAAFIDTAVKSKFQAIEAAGRKEYYPLSAAQTSLFILQQMYPEGTAYNLPMAFILEGNIEKEKLENTFRQLIRRHESLRTSFKTFSGEPLQKIHDEVEFEIEYNVLATGDTEGKIHHSSFIIHHFIRAFDLSKAPLLRVGLLEIEREKYILVIDMHHIISDGTSMGILVNEFMSFYKGEGSELPPLRVQYKDYAHRQRGEEMEKSIRQQRIYWLKEFEGEIPVLNLPTDYPRPLLQQFEGGHIVFELSGEETGQLNEIAGSRDATLFMVLLAIYYIFLSKISGQEEIVVGTAVSGRRHADLEGIIGMFVNTLVLKNYPRCDITFFRFLEDVKEKMLKAFENQEFPFEELVERVLLTRDASRNPLFDVMVVLQNIEVRDLEIPGLTLKPYEIEDHTAKFDMNMAASEISGHLVFEVEYCTKLFKKETVERFSWFFRRVISSVIENPRISIGEIEIISWEEKVQLLYDFNDTGAAYPVFSTIHRLFEEQATKTPDRTVVIYEDEFLTYNELNERAEKLAYVLQFKGVAAEAAVGIMARHSLEMIIGITAILKAGGGYLPINPDYPQSRKKYLLRDSNVGILLTTHGLTLTDGVDFEGDIVIIGRFSEPIAVEGRGQRRAGSSADLAYIIYTSGSTGIPKGVMVNHRNVVRLVKNTDFIDFREGERLLQTGALEFDASTLEIWGPLLNGLTLCLVEKETLLSADDLKEILSAFNIALMWMTAPLFNQMLQADSEIFKGLRHLLVGGDVLSPVHISRLRKRFPRLKISNGYGPTENTTFSTTFTIASDYTANIPIGRPIANSTVYIVDRKDHLQPMGIGGELVVGGDGVSRGYLNDPELTSEKFHRDLWNRGGLREHKFFEARRFYKTGDLARWLPDGTVEFLGRLDFQVKIRGFRIELGEIENRLLEHEGVKDAVVIARKRENADPYLAAHIVRSPGGEFESMGDAEMNSCLRQFLLLMLPDYMIPSFFIFLDRMPLNPNGKVDREALPEPGPVVGEPGKDYMAPVTAVEMRLVELWSDALGIAKENIGIDADFFELGGNSLTAVRLNAHIHQTFNVKLALKEIFTTPTIRGLARFIEKAAAEQYANIEPVEKKDYYVLSAAQKRLYLVHQMIPDYVVYNMPQVVPLAGEIDKKKLQQTFKTLLQRHESLRTSFVIVSDEPVQRIHDEVDFEIPEVRGKDRSLEEVAANFVRPFDLSRAPLLRATLVELPGNNGENGISGDVYLLLDMHHIITDGLSQEILENEFRRLYGGETLASLRVQYKDFSEWQTGKKQQTLVKEQENYWLQQFPDELTALNLPLDYPRPFVQSFEGNTVEFQLTRKESDVLRAAARELDVTLFMGILAVFNILLAKLGGQEDIIVGVPIAGRRHADLEPIIGMFVNMLALRNYPLGEKRVGEFLGEVKEHTLSAYENQEYPFEQLVDKLNVTRDTGRNPVFDVVFNWLSREEGHGGDVDDIGNIPGTDGIDSTDSHIDKYDHRKGTAKFDLTLTAVDPGEQLFFIFEYCSKLFAPATIERFIAYFKELLDVLSVDLNRELSELEIITDGEKRQILFEFNEEYPQFPVDITIHQLFVRQVEERPDTAALVDAGYRESESSFHRDIEWEMQISYRALNEKADGLGGRLQREGVRANCFVGLLAERSLGMIVGILGTWKAGAAYVPLNPKAPADRNRFIIKDCNITKIVATGSLYTAAQELNADGEIINVDNFLTVLPASFAAPVHHAGNLAYAIFTSGSTGKPKGVAITHANLCPLLYWGYRRLGLGCRDRAIQNLSYYFDWSVWEIFITLTSGACLYMVSEELLLNPAASIDFMERKDMTVLHVTPTQYRHFIHGGQRLSSLKYLFLGAEKLTLDLLERSFASVGEGCRVFNMYGPTEATIISGVLEISRGEESKFALLGSVPIGKPSGNATLSILDRSMNLCPLNVTGELYIGGDGVARGYLNNPGLTWEKFCLVKSFSGGLGGRFYKKAPLFYRTGDLARWLPDGTVEFLGRLDFQVKIRGFRIELGEIENRLLEHEGVKDAVVIARKRGNADPYLAAYIVRSPGGEFESMGDTEINSCLRQFLLLRLPDYMIPSFFIFLDRMPLNPNGKVDRKALPEPGPVVGEPGKDYMAPVTAVEMRLVELWSDALGIAKEDIGIDADFFELGGNSLSAVRLNTHIHQAFNIKLALKEIFTTPTIRGLARFIEKAAAEQYASIEPVEKKDYYVLSPAQKRLYLVHQMIPDYVVYNMPQVVPLAGEIDKKRLQQTFKTLLQRHESLRTSFEIVGDEPVQRIHDEVDFEISEVRGKDRSLEEVAANFVRPFDLSRAPLLRATLVELPGDNGENGISDDVYLLLDMHHIITDGLSQEILENEFRRLYGGEALVPLRVQYKDFSEWQTDQKQQILVKEQENYWLKQFPDELTVLNLPIDYPRPSVQSFEGNMVDFLLTEKESGVLMAVARELNVTLFMGILAVFNILLAKLGGQEDIIVGVPIAGRRHADLEPIIGMFVNMLALRNYPRGEKKFGEFLEEVKEHTLSAYENQEYPFEQLVDKLNVTRDTGRNPVFDVVFNWLSREEGHGDDVGDMGDIPGIDGTDSHIDRHEHRNGTAKFDLTFTAVEMGRETLFSIQYCTKLFRKETIERFSRYFKKILSIVVNEPGIRISDIDIISEEEKKRILYDFNKTEALFPEDKTIYQLFEEQASRTPDRIAVIGSTAVETLRAASLQITYRQLNEHSGRLAGLLIEKGVLADNIVAVMTERSLEMIIGIFGILKASGAYLPIDPGYPQDRIDYMLKDSAAKMLVTANDKESEKVRRWEGEKVFLEFIIHHSNHLSFHHSSFIIHHSNHLSYIIYTSGSTGMPKGVMIEHRSVVNRLNWMQKAYPIDCSDVILQKTAFTFDVSLWELFWWSSRGACVSLLGIGGEKDPSAIVAAVANYRVTTMHFVPSMLNVLLDYLENDAGDETVSRRLRSLRQVFASGEALGPVQVERFYGLFGRRGAPAASLINLYGPTEATVDVSYFDCSPGEKYERIPIGKPIDNINLYVLDRSFHLQPVGVVGELHIAGVGLARGYLNRPELTAERFIDFQHSSFSIHHSNLYSTGDLARWLDDGNIEFLGRVDHQVKIRGFRIELGEIENRLLVEPAVKEAVVAAQIDRSGAARLAAYVVPDETYAFTVHRLLEIKRNKLQGERPYYELPNGMPVFYLNRNETEFMYREIFEELSYLKHGVTLPEGSCIFDIGANIGIFSLFANHVCKDAKIYSFEPAPPLYDLLALNTSLYGTNFKIFKNGIASVEEEVVFTYYPHASILSGRFADEAEEKETVRAVIHKELESAGDDKPTEEQIDELLAERLSGVRFDCAMKTVSQVMRENGVQRIDLLKIDVEKAELDVLEGIEAADWPKIRQLVIEVHDSGGRLNRIMDLLERYGYKMAVEQDSMLEETDLYNLYAVRAQQVEAREEGQAAPVGQVEPGRYNPGRLIDDLRGSLKGRLPDYMVPSHFVLLDKMPLTASGKVDRKALPMPETAARGKGEDWTGPRNALENLLADIWSEVLGLEKETIGVDDNFFERGGDSLKAFFVTSKIKKTLQVELPIPEFFNRPTIGSIAAFLADMPGLVLAGGEGGVDRAMVQEEIETFIQQPSIIFNRLASKTIYCFPPVLAFGIAYKVLASAIPDYAFYCFNFLEDEDRIKKYLDIVTAHQPVGPYILAGFSAGGKLTVEAAAALESRGLEVAGVILIDSFWPGEDIAVEPGADVFQEIETYLEELGVHFLKEKLLAKIASYWAYFSKKNSIGPVKTKFHLVVSEERWGSPLCGSWEPYTAHSPVIYRGFGKHADMIYAAGIEKNAGIIRDIITKIESRT